jgi:hypothetical protein
MKVETRLKHLFVSQTRGKLINIFFYFPKQIFYVRELVRLTKEEINSVRRELENLKKGGILMSEARGNRLYYWANPDSSFFSDLLVLAHKNSGLGQALIEKSSSIGRIKLAFCSYQFLTGEPNTEDSVDLILVGNISLKEIEQLAKKEENTLGREINYMVMDKSEFKLRKNKRDSLLVDFFLNCPLLLLGNPHDLFDL